VSALKLLQSASSIHDLAHLLGYKPASLGYVAYGLKPPLRYHSFEIQKRSGGFRTISAPAAQLKTLQRRLAAYLQKCLDEIDSASPRTRHISHGFSPGRSIFSNAASHRKRAFVLNVDLEDFFGSIHFGRVRGFFVENKNFRLHPEVAKILAQIVCDNGTLPQGAPTSPVISNMLGHILDMRLWRIAQRYNCSYTRYADDLTFSTSLPEFPHQLAFADPGCPNQWQAGKELKREIARCGFSVNEKKTRLQLRRSRQEVTGVVVNQRLNVRSDYRRTARAMLHRLRKSGSFEIEGTETSGGTSTKRKITGTLNQLEGMLAFLRQADNEHAKRTGIAFTDLSPAERLQKRFVFYRTFAAAQKPVIMFEGATDAIYIREALRKLASKFPSLAATVAGRLKLNATLFKPTKHIARLAALSGGSSEFVKFIQEYTEDFKHIGSPKKGRNPIIVVLDNDDGAKPVLDLIKKRFKKSLPDGDRSLGVFENLYICLTSPHGAPHHCMEDFFEAAVLSEKIGGKSFSKSNKLDTTKEYGKVWLAEKIVRPHASTINFDGFIPLLTELDSLIKKHSSTAGP